jgi:prepilin-type N-terminal cleavage/methylation domain-containing protein
MELKPGNNGKFRQSQRGMSLIELMIAMVVLLVGIVGSMSLIAYAISGNGRSRQQSNATVISQMVAEKISSQKASLSNNLTITDCASNSTTVFTGAGGATLTSAGDADYSQTAVNGYQMNYTDCGTNGRLMMYDVRWNITQPTPYVKMITVSTQMKNAGTNARVFSLPVTIRTLVGQGT